MGIEFLRNQLRAFGKMFSGELSVKENLGSIISIGKMYGTSWDWERFWTLTASLSILLAFMNLLPIPALDGGYVVFLLWEVITGRKVGDRFMEKAVTVGFFLLLGLMVYAFGLDLWRHVFQHLF
jgi:regulator of sigma E protease